MPIFSKKSSRDAPRRRQQEQATVPERASEQSLGERYAFRRNRTLTGSVSSQVSSLNEGSAQLKSPRVHAHELSRKRRHIGASLLLVAAVCAALYGLIWQFTASVVVRANDLTMQLDSSYVQDIEAYFSTQPLQRLRFLTNDQQLTEYVQTKAPEVASVSMDSNVGFGKTQFIITVRKPIAGWNMNNKQQYVDTSGVAFSRNYFTAPSVQIVDKSGIQVQAGQAVASNRFLAFVGLVVGIAPQWNYKVTQVTIPANTTRQIELTLEGVKYPVKMSVDRPAGEQMEDMARAIAWVIAHNVSPQYVDVRVSGKAYYR